MIRLEILRVPLVTYGNKVEIGKFKLIGLNRKAVVFVKITFIYRKDFLENGHMDGSALTHFKLPEEKENH